MDAARELVLEAVEVEVWSALDAAGVRPIVLKGRSIARLLYPDVHRPSSDVDVLVDPRREDEAADVLGSLGYERYGFGLDPRLSGGETWVRARDRPPVDLHRTLPFVRADHARAFDELWRHVQRVTVADRELATLDPPGVALHVALHAARNGPAAERTLEDLRRACGRLGTDVWETAASLARAIDATGGLVAGLTMIPEGRRLASELRLPVSAATLVEGLAARGMPELVPGILAVGALPGWGARLRAAIRLLLPSPSRQRGRWALARRGTLGLVASYVVWPAYLLGAGARLAIAVVRSAGRRRALDRC